MGAARAVRAVGFVEIAVAVDLAGPVAQLPDVAVVADDGLGLDRDLAAAAGGVDDVGGHGVAGGVAAQLLHQLDPASHGGPQVPAAEHRIALVEVVRTDAQLEQAVEQLAQHRHGIVDALEQHRLAAERDAAVGQQVGGLRHLRRQLARVAEVDRQPDPVLAQHRHQLGRDALRQEAGDAGADAQELEVRDVAQPAEQLVEGGVRHQQRVAAGEQHVAHLVMRLQVGDHGVDAAAERLELALADQAAAGAVAAVGRASVEDEEEHAVGIAVHQALDDAGAVLVEGVGHVARRDDQLAFHRHHLLADRAGRVLGIDQRREVWRHGDRELLARQRQPPPLGLGEPQQALELIETGQAVAHLPPPVPPGGGIVAVVDDGADLFASGGQRFDNRGVRLMLHRRGPPLRHEIPSRAGEEMVPAL